MKGSLILVLVSALVAAPLFADTITLKSGQTYTGEVVKKTNEYIHLKTDTEVLRIPLSDIAKIATPEGEIDVRIQEALMPEAVAMAHAAAAAKINKGLWCATGFFLSCAGVGIAYTVEPPYPDYYLIGKSPEYIASFTYTYKRKAKNIQTARATLGCAISGIAWGCAGCITSWKAQFSGDPDKAGCLFPN